MKIVMYRMMKMTTFIIMEQHHHLSSDCRDIKQTLSSWVFWDEAVEEKSSKYEIDWIDVFVSIGETNKMDYSGQPFVSITLLTCIHPVSWRRCHI